MMKYIRPLFYQILLFLLIIMPLLINGQLLSVKNVTKEYGLNRSEVYRIFTDKKGYLWVTAAPGIFRFDGYQFEEMFKDHSLHVKNIYMVNQDDDGNIYFLSDYKVLYKYDGVNLSETDLSSKSTCNFPRNNLRTAESFYIDSINRVHVGDGSRYGHIIFGCTEEERESSLNRKKNYACLDKTKKPDFFSVSLREGFRFMGEEFPLVIKNTQKDTTILIPTDHYRYPFLRFRCYTLKRNKNIISLGRRVYFIKENNELVVKDFSSDVIYAFEDNNGRIWISEAAAKIHVLDQDFNLLNYDFSELENSAVTTIFQDEYNGFWFATFKNGLFYSPGMSTGRLVTGIDISDIEGDGNGGAFVCSKNGILYQIDSDLSILKTWNIGYGGPYLKIGMVNHIKELNLLVIGTVKGTVIVDLETDKVIKPSILDAIYPYEAELLSDSSLIIMGANTRTFVLNKSSKKSEIKVFEMEIDCAVYCSVRDTKGDIWLSTKHGLRVLKNGETTKPFSNDTLFDKGMYDIDLVNDQIWGTGPYYGLIASDGDSVYRLGDKLGIPNLSVLVIEQLNDSIVWLGAREGLFELNIKDKKYHAKPIGSPEGVREGQVIRVEKSGDKVWLSINGEYFLYSPSSLNSKNNSSQLHITKIEEGRIECKVNNENKFEYGDKVLRFHFRSLNFSRQGKISYQYRLNGLSDKWIETKEPVAQYSGLYPGGYTFEVRAKNNDDTWTDSKSVSFSVLPAFWQTIWFKFLIVCVLIYLIYLLMKYRSGVVKKKEVIKTELAHLELKALKAQINPHFIFNSIASVQYYLSKNKPEEAQQYMQDFAQLIRKVLEHSDSNLVSLNSELKVIDNYVKLESQKFKGNGIIYMENIDKGVDPDKILIPPALIQPYVENAIWHGLKDKAEQREIALSIVKNKEKLVIAIKDNGIGRDASKEKNKNKKTKSFGMSITAERIKILNGTKGEDYVQVKDLKDDLGKALGTEILLLVPYINVKERIAI